MNNLAIVELLRNVSAALTIKKANRFRIVAYDKAADAIEHLTSEVKDLWDNGKLDTIPGVGQGIASSLDELIKTGKVKHFAQIFKNISPAVFPLLKVPGLGPKRADKLTKILKVSDPKSAINQLETAAKQNKIAQIEGWGDKSQAELVSAIETYKKGQIKENRMPLPIADALAKDFINYMRQIPQVLRIDALGSLRRKVATIGDIDLSVMTHKPQIVLSKFINYPKVRKIIDRGPKGATVLLSIGRQVDLRVQEPKAYGAMLQYFTGSKHHNIKLREYAQKQGLSLNEHGIKILKKIKNSELRIKNFNQSKKLYEFETEENLYKSLGMDWIPPELREDKGEIEAALFKAQGNLHGLPALVKLSDIKGDLHIHSNYDLQPSHDLGNSELEALLYKAVEFNYEYIGISDHNPKVSGLTEKQIIDIMKRRKHTFEQIYDSWKTRVKNRVQLFIMLEIDIDTKGYLALPNEAFAYIDAAIVSIHSSFNQTKEQMTRRILNGLNHPKAKIFGHPTARLISSREGIEADWEIIFDYCKKNNKALEINSWPDRLDLPDRLVKDAVERQVKLIINTDSHDVSQLEGIIYGVDVARRGWAEKKDILNTLEYNKFKEWLIT